MCIRDRLNLRRVVVGLILELHEPLLGLAVDRDPVSYTHLDVYKRQVHDHAGGNGNSALRSARGVFVHNLHPRRPRYVD